MLGGKEDGSGSSLAESAECGAIFVSIIIFARFNYEDKFSWLICKILLSDILFFSVASRVKSCYSPFL